MLALKSLEVDAIYIHEAKHNEARTIYPDLCRRSLPRYIAALSIATNTKEDQIVLIRRSSWTMLRFS